MLGDFSGDPSDRAQAAEGRGHRYSSSGSGNLPLANMNGDGSMQMGMGVGMPMAAGAGRVTSGGAAAAGFEARSPPGKQSEYFFLGGGRGMARVVRYGSFRSKCRYARNRELTRDRYQPCSMQILSAGRVSSWKGVPIQP